MYRLVRLCPLKAGKGEVELFGAAREILVCVFHLDLGSDKFSVSL